MTKSPYLGIDLFAGSGGISHGLLQAGLDMRLGIEIDPNFAVTLKENNKNMKVVVSDIRVIDPAEVVKSTGLRKKDIDLIVGGPPCQGFSQSNRRSRNLDNPLNNLYKEFFRFIRVLQPQVFLLENVAGLKTLHRGAVFRDILKTGEKVGYYVQWDVVNAEDFGVPQRRKRIIFIGTKQKTDNLFYVKENKAVTVRSALDDLPILENGNAVDELKYSRDSKLSNYQKIMRKNNGNIVSNNLVTKNSALVVERYKYIPPGGNWKNIPPHLMSNYKNANNCHGWIYYRLIWDGPSVVISNFRKNMLIHPEQHRGLSVREAARLQSFPDDYIFYGPLGFQQQKVANACPPLLVEKIGNNIMKYLREAN
jgi:DNA (cytosine-5)-methyltransferase 1